MAAVRSLVIFSRFFSRAPSVSTWTSGMLAILMSSIKAFLLWPCAMATVAAGIPLPIRAYRSDLLWDTTEDGFDIRVINGGSASSANSDAVWAAGQPLLEIKFEIPPYNFAVDRKSRGLISKLGSSILEVCETIEVL